MEMLFLKLLNMSINASILVLIVMVFRLVFKSAPKWINCLLWTLVGIRLVIPFSLESRVSLIPREEPIPTAIVYQLNPQLNSSSQVINEYVSNSLAGSPYDSATRTGVLFFALGCIWLIGFIAMLLYSLTSYIVLRNKLRTSTLYAKGIKQSDCIDSPFVLGIFKPTIYIPYSLSGQNLEYVISHEESHIRRKDFLWKPLGFLILSVHWFNPAIWVAYIFLCRDIESACDEKVISELSMDSRKDYSQALLNLSVKHKFITACPVAFGEEGVKSRITGIVNYKKPAFKIIVIAIITCIVIGICFITNPVSDKATSTEESDAIVIDVSGETEASEVILSQEEEIVAELTEETEESIVDASVVIPNIGAPNILGFTDWNYEIVAYVPGVHYGVTVYSNEDHIALGTWFGFANEQYTVPDMYLVDIDDDGNYELICNCQYGGDGAERVYIYRNNNGTIEQGSVSEATYRTILGLSDADWLPQPGAMRETYDAEYNVIRVTVERDMVFEVAPSDTSSIEYLEYVN